MPRRLRSAIAAIAYVIGVGVLAAAAVVTGNPVYFTAAVVASLPFGLMAFGSLYVIYGLARQAVVGSGVADFATGTEPAWFHTAFSVVAVVVFAVAAAAHVVVRSLVARRRARQAR